MNIKFSRIAPCLIVLALLGSCNKKEEKKTPVLPKQAAGQNDTTGAAALPNYRYVDLDSVLAKYNLALDFNEQAIKQQSSMEADMQKLQDNYTNQQKVMQDKLQSGQYQSEADMEADQKRLMELQQNAQEKIAQIQEEVMKMAEKNQKTIKDSITNFIESYNASHGYDAIFDKAATIYMNPALDITDEVIEGLNARYNKVKK